MLDSDLAKLYGVKTSNLNKAVKRNLDRFPQDFMFKLTSEEYKSLRFHFGILEKGKHSKYLPKVFTEHGILMLSSVLNSKRAIQVNIQIMRVFVKIREFLATHKELAQKLNELERKTAKHDVELKAVFEAIRHIMAIEEKPKKQIGFRP